MALARSWLDVRGAVVCGVLCDELCCLVCCVVVVLCVVWVFFPLNSLLSLSRSLFLSCSFLLLFCLPLSLSLLSSSTTTVWSTDQQTWRPTLTRFACDLEHGRCIALAFQFTASLPPPLLSSPPLPTLKKSRELYITRKFPARELFCITVLN